MAKKMVLKNRIMKVDSLNLKFHTQMAKKMALRKSIIKMGD